MRAVTFSTLGESRLRTQNETLGRSATGPYRNGGSSQGDARGCPVAAYKECASTIEEPGQRTILSVRNFFSSLAERVSIAHVRTIITYTSVKKREGPSRLSRVTTIRKCLLELEGEPEADAAEAAVLQPWIGKAGAFLR
jgi:hypothetical protein